ncbi:MAG: signaling protein, partial [Telluria sp.]
MNAPLDLPPLVRTVPPTATRRSTWARRFAPLRETHIALPPFALVLIVVLWIAAFNVINRERREAETAARDAARELVDTYEAQMARSLSAIDQTLKVLKYAVEQDGAWGAITTLRRQGLLPP